MIAIIAGVIQLIFLILKNKYNQDEEDKQRKKEIANEWKDAIKSGDASRINTLIDKLRK